ncbi:hypothetical protein BT96DRAFT_34092 [Gymnopus androsaceus JB14]|uniref:Uncharacterized protein n=1 Tax=Gymnopus androsaceus JB14 TaxID=1447944 RepID=A0A6A4GDR6_9AGAR|nr:hypothetical protein BT96DRAFT_34092 [Gymnopus androsaceus JB14]
MDHLHLYIVSNKGIDIIVLYPWFINTKRLDSPLPNLQNDQDLKVSSSFIALVTGATWLPSYHLIQPDIQHIHGSASPCDVFYFSSWYFDSKFGPPSWSFLRFSSSHANSEIRSMMMFCVSHPEHLSLPHSTFLSKSGSPVFSSFITHWRNLVIF